MRGKVLAKRSLALIVVLMLCVVCLAGCDDDNASTDNSDVREFKGLAVTFNKINSWENNNLSYAQYEVSIENHAGPTVYAWKFAIPAAGSVSNDNNWNCNLNINNGNVNISNMDYNGTIDSNTTYNGVGMIFKSNNSSDLDKIVGTYLINKDTGVGRLLNNDELKAFREGPNGGSNASANTNVTPAPAKEPEVGTPLANYGALHVDGVNLVDSKGAMYQLKGVSTHGLQWFPQYVNEGAFRNLRDNWGANVVRLAMYTDENGYCAGGDKARLEQVIDDGVNAATNLGMYVIIDWHFFCPVFLVQENHRAGIAET